jgi:hypothetical protein
LPFHDACERGREERMGFDQEHSKGAVSRYGSIHQGII